MADKNAWVPWYRRKDYKGELSEEDKRILDSFRLKEKHPSTCYEDLPDDVQSYINRIELELFDKKQESAAGKAFALTCIAVFLIYLAFIGQVYSSIFAYLSGAGIIFFAWFQYRRAWTKNANDLFPKEDGAPNQSEQGIQAEWEFDYLVRLRRQKDVEIEPDD